MGVVARQGIKTSVVSYFGAALGIVTTLWLYPGFLTPEEIGLMTILVNVSLMIVPFAQFGVNGAMIKFLPEFKNDPERRKSFLFFTLLILAVGFLVAITGFYFFRGFMVDSFIERSPQFIDYFHLLIPLTIFILIGNFFASYSRSQLRIAVPNLIRDVFQRFFIIILLLCYAFFGFEQSIFIHFLVVAYALIAVIMGVYVNKLSPFRIKFSLKGLDKSFLKETIVYCLFFLLAGFAGLIVTKIDTWMIGSMIDLESTGIYSISLYIGMAIEIPKRSINLISFPLISQAMKVNDQEQVNKLYKKSALVLFIVGSLFLIGVWVNIDNLFLIMPQGEVFAEGKYVVLFIGLAVLIDMALGVNTEIIVASRYFRYNFIVMAGLIIFTIINNLIFIPIYGITGAAIATAISIFLYNVIKSGIIWWKLKIHPFSKGTLVIAGLALAILLLGWLLPDVGIPFLSIAYKSILLTVLFAAGVYFTKVSEDINQGVEKGLGFIRSKLK